MTATERRQEILNTISTEGSVRASDLAERLNVTTETIRKDLIFLNNKHLLKKGHGGAQAINEFTERSLDVRAQENALAKRAIANCAIKQIDDGSVVFVDAGSTMVDLARQLRQRSGLAIITNNLSVIPALLESGNAIYFLGGEVSSVTQATGGIWAANALKSIKIDVAFLGSSGFQSHTGPCTKIFSDAQLKRDVITSANKSVVLADHTKFSTNAIMQYADWSDVDVFITDAGASSDEIATLERCVEVLVAGNE